MVICSSLYSILIQILQYIYVITTTTTTTIILTIIIINKNIINININNIQITRLISITVLNCLITLMINVDESIKY